MIEVVDFKGTRWGLVSIGRYKVSRQGLTEIWCIRFSVADVLPGYSSVPIPVFAEWWP